MHNDLNPTLTEPDLLARAEAFGTEAKRARPDDAWTPALDTTLRGEWAQAGNPGDWDAVKATVERAFAAQPADAVDAWDTVTDPAVARLRSNEAPPKKPVTW